MFDTLLRSIQNESKVVSRKVYMYKNFNSTIGMKVLFLSLAGLSLSCSQLH